MTVATFHDSDGPGANERFERWRQAHPDGFILNYGSPNDMVLHRPGCLHFVFHTPRSLTSYKKVCADSVDELEAWAARNSRGLLRTCRTCSPRT